MIVIVFKYLTPKWVRGVTIFPFILLSQEVDKENRILLNHEKIHIRQQIELLVLPFYLWYGIEFVIRFIQNRNAKEAYLNISFEREAYQNENNLFYLKQRSFLNFIKYL
jgi:hypothetical protein